MRLRDVQAQNFRSFPSAEIRLSESGLVLIAGANNSGKSALLSAVDAVAGDSGDLGSLRFALSEESARLRATFDLTEAERASILANASGGPALQDWSSDRLMIAATHSAVMLDWSPGGERLWHVSRDHGVSRADQVDVDPRPLLSSLGVRLSDVLSADKVLVLEGLSDQDVLRVWFPDVLRNPRVAVLEGEGGEKCATRGQARCLAGRGRPGGASARPLPP
jgi:energy-coupling factor transporter ATP-binding protein EcfA2